MPQLEVNGGTAETIKNSFKRIAEKLFNDYQLQINESVYRLIDIEFYYFAQNVHEDIYAHKHENQLEKGKWYFHGSGIDITFGNGKNYGGILIRGIVKLFGDATPEKNFIQREIHGPLNVKTEICSNLHDVFNDEPNIFKLTDISGDRMMAGMKLPSHIIKTKRIGLALDKDNSPGQKFYNGKFRFVIFPYLKLKNKTQIAMDMQSQFPNLSIQEINKQLGSIFLK